MKFELVTLDNRDHRFKSAAEALNVGGQMTKGEYIMFAHQDMWFENNTWIEEAEDILNSLPHLGVAGVAGVSEKNESWEKRAQHSIIFHDGGFDKIKPVKKAEEVQTLDECVLIVPRSVFIKLKFDEDEFSGWDCYGSDYCLSVIQLGLKSYVLPLMSRHCNARAKNSIWEFQDLRKYQKKLYKKHKHIHKKIYTWMGVISWQYFIIISVLSYLGPLIKKIFLDFSDILSNELSGCDRVLDLGCGYRSVLYRCKVPFAVAIDLSEYSLRESRRYCIHNQYLCGDIREIEFKPKTFDAVIAMDIIDQFTTKETNSIVSKMENWARKKIIFTVSNRITSCDSREGKHYWNPIELKRQGFKIYGIGGWKIINQGEKYNFFRNLVVNLSQKIVYYFPKQASGFLVIKQIKAK